VWSWPLADADVVVADLQEAAMVAVFEAVVAVAVLTLAVDDRTAEVAVMEIVKEAEVVTEEKAEDLADTVNARVEAAEEVAVIATEAAVETVMAVVAVIVTAEAEAIATAAEEAADQAAVTKALSSVDRVVEAAVVVADLLRHHVDTQAATSNFTNA